mmetsp:Transcript_77459/g.237078  ORF Transcript_77459/g.237078 Transcript_77459/m.237078 type:complete len:248 (-) Transcript_77459:1549-2292(-)
MPASFVFSSIKFTRWDEGSVSSLPLSPNRQMTRNDSPLFLLGAPKYSFTTPWTISAIWFTKVMILDCSTSVAVLKSRIRTTPMMHSTRRPGIMASTPALSPPRMLWPMMFAPASPNPSASKEPNLMMVFSRITVSIGSLVAVVQTWPLATCPIMCLTNSFFALAFLALANSSFLNSSSAIFMAISGLSRMASTRSIMRSTGCTMRRLASLVKARDTMISKVRIEAVLIKFICASVLEYGRRSKANQM